jgi:hypothetical protein
LGYLDNVHRQGAGLLKIDKAILSTTKIEPGKLALRESAAGPVTRTLTVTNQSGSQLTYDLSSVSALATGANTFTPSFSWYGDSVTFSAPSLTVPAGGTGTVNVTISPGGYPSKSLYGGYIVFTPREGGQVYRVPYAGFMGDYQTMSVMPPTSYGFPWLATLTSGSYYNQAGGATYTLAGADIPYFLVHFDHGAQVLRMAVTDANTGKSWHWADNEKYIARNSTGTGFYAIPWDGSTYQGGKSYAVPSGQYTMSISVLKPLGDPNNPADWETWTSPTITVARP